MKWSKRYNYTRRRRRRRGRGRCAHTRTLASACAAPNSQRDLVARSELDLSPRVAGRRARTRWPLRATVNVRRRSLVGTRDRVACAQILPGTCVAFGCRTLHCLLVERLPGVGGKAQPRYAREDGVVKKRCQCVVATHSHPHSTRTSTYTTPTLRCTLGRVNRPFSRLDTVRG